MSLRQSGQRRFSQTPSAASGLGTLPLLPGLNLANPQITQELDPAPQGLRCAANLRRDRADRRPLRGVLALMLEHHPNRAFANFRCVFRRCLLRHGSSLSRVGASGNPGAVHGRDYVSATEQRHQRAHYYATQHAL